MNYFLQNIEIEDKLAFAAIHLDDDILSSALDRLLTELDEEKRPLSALLITGLDDHSDSHKLIHKLLLNNYYLLKKYLHKNLDISIVHMTFKPLPFYYQQEAASVNQKH